MSADAWGGIETSSRIMTNFKIPRKLQRVELRYSIYGRESVAICYAAKHFCYMVKIRKSYIKINHIPLIYSFQQQ